LYGDSFVSCAGPAEYNARAGCEWPADRRIGAVNVGLWLLEDSRCGAYITERHAVFIYQFEFHS
jgi:hypothetical protein